SFVRLLQNRILPGRAVAIGRAGMSCLGLVRYSTFTTPVICGCSEQKYLYSPGAVNVNEKAPSVSMVFDLNLPAHTTVWGMSSRLVQVTVWPTLTVSCAGSNTKLSMCTANGAAVSSARVAPTGRSMVATTA